MMSERISEMGEIENSNKRLLRLGFWASVLFVLIAGVCQLMVGLIAAVLLLFFKHLQIEITLLAAFVSNSFAFLIFYLFFIIKNYDLRDVFQCYPYKWLLIIPLLLASLALQISGSELDNLVRMIFPPSALDDLIRKIFPPLAIFEEFMESMRQMMLIRSGFGIILLILSACLVGPAFEELLFRGIIFTGLRRKFSFGLALIIQALLFGLMHGNPWQFLYAFILGILLGLLVKWSGSISPAILLHIFINSSAVIFNNLFQTKGVVQTSEIEHVEPRLLALSIIVGILSIYWFYILREKPQAIAIEDRE